MCSSKTGAFSSLHSYEGVSSCITRAVSDAVFYVNWTMVRDIWREIVTLPTAALFILFAESSLLLSLKLFQFPGPKS